MCESHDFAVICSQFLNILIYYILSSVSHTKPFIMKYLFSGLLEALIEHWRASLIAMFDLTKELELSNAKADSNRKRKRDRGEKRLDGVRWYQSCKSADDDLFAPANVDGEEGLGSVNSEVLRRGDKVRILHHQPKDFTTEARFTEKDFQVGFVNGY